MLLTDFLTVALIPPLISPISNSSTQSKNDGVGTSGLVAPYSSELFSNENFFGDKSLNIPESSQTRTNDPALRAVYEEEKRLGLSDIGNEDDMRSEEARELITFQRNKLQASQPNTGRFLFSSEGGVPFFQGPGNQKFNAEYLSPTDFTVSPPPPLPINDNTRMLPDDNVEDEIIPRSTHTVVARSGIGGAFDKFRGGFRNAIGGIKQTFWGSSYQPSSLSTEKPSVSPPNAIFFPTPESRTPSGESNPINFGPSENTETQRPIVENLKCLQQQTVYNGACHNVLQQLPCPVGYWLIEDDVTGKGKCVENKCSGLKNYAFFAGDCIEVRSQKSEEKCHRGMTTYIFKNGEVECDCKDNHLFNQRDGNCYGAYRRGPCRQGEVFVAKVSKAGTLPASCIRSKCSKDGYVCNAPSCPGDRNCVQLGSECDGGRYDIDAETLSPKCVPYDDVLYRIIGNVPTLACAPGSRRDILGTCRKPTKITFS